MKYIDVSVGGKCDIFYLIYREKTPLILITEIDMFINCIKKYSLMHTSLQNCLCKCNVKKQLLILINFVKHNVNMIIHDTF